MARIATISLALCAVAFFSACSKPKPEPVTIEPSIDKMGNATCPAGTTLAIMGSTGRQVCVDPSTM